ncbi:MAG: hypothetical protein WD016_06465 [Balneolaceae bacterium]
MKATLKVMVLFSITVFFISCNNSENKDDATQGMVISNPEYGEFQDSGNPPFQFTLIDSIAVEIPDDYIVSGFSSFLTDENGDMYFMDRRQSKLISIAADGKFRWITGQEGKGPGDFENAYSMITDGEQLIIGNIQGSRMDRFSFNGEFISSHTMPKEISFSNYKGVTEDGNIIVTTPVWGRFGLNVFIIKTNKDSIDVLSEFELDQSNGLEAVEGVNSSATLSIVNNQIISGSVGGYSISIFNLDGENEKTITRDFDKIVRPGVYSSEGSKSIRGFGGVDAPKVLPNGYFFITAQWPVNVSDPDKYLRDSINGNAPEVITRNTLDFFNPDGKLLYSQEAEGYQPEIGDFSYVDENGVIYVTKTDPSPIIYRYKVSTPEI